MARTQAEQFSGVEIRQRSRSRRKPPIQLCWTSVGRFPRALKILRRTWSLSIWPAHSLFGSEEEIARQLTEGASRFGLTAQVALASNPDVAIHAARGFPGITLIPPGEESQRLGCLPVGVLFPAAEVLETEVLETLDRWGVRTCQAWRHCRSWSFRNDWGRRECACTNWRAGKRSRSLVLAEPALTLKKKWNWKTRVEELEPLHSFWGGLLDQLCARLVARSLAAGAIRFAVSSGDYSSQHI